MKRLLPLLLFIPLFANASIDKKSFDEGVNKFIKAGRNMLMANTNANALYTFERTLLKTDELKCLLPNTFKSLEVMTATSIFTTQLGNTEIWEKKISEDLALLPYKLAAYAKEKTKEAFCGDTGLYKLLTSDLKPGDSRSVELTKLKAKVKTLVFDPISTKITNRAAGVAGITKAELDNLETDFNDKIKVFSQVLDDKFNPAKSLAGLYAQATQQGLDGPAFEALFLDPAVGDLGYEKLTSKIIDIIADIKELEGFEEILDDGEFTKTIRYITFFTELADAEDSTAVEKILTTYTLPAVSYYVKRNSGSHFLITSYVGLTANFDDNQAETVDASSVNIFAPVGLEYTWGSPNCMLMDSISIMASPLDFGYPISLKTSGIEENIDFDEIIAPSITVSTGFRNVPVSFGIGYQQGARVVGTDKTEERGFVFIAFDMPLWEIF